MAGEVEECYSSDELTSDEELQVELAKGDLRPGLIARAAPPKTVTNNVAGLREKLAFLKKKELEWLERMDVTSQPSPSTLQSEGEASNEKMEEEGDGVDPEDDFKREMHFYQQACSSVQVGLRKLEELGVPVHRPEDYFAEMVKTDDHMRKVRESLLSRQKVLEHKEKSRKLRELKKYGKKVQQEILQKRREEKKSAVEAVKKFRKGKGEKPSFLKRGEGEMDDDAFPVIAEKESGGAGGVKRAPKRSGPKEKSKKRQQKDTKFGYGGKKKWQKSNTADSSADMSHFSSKKHSKGTTALKRLGGRGSKVKVKRLGKSRRQKMKLKR